MQTISVVSSNVAVREDSSPCSRGLWLYEEQSNVTSPCGRDWVNQTIFVNNSLDLESGNYACRVFDAQLSRYYRRKRRY